MTVAENEIDAVLAQMRKCNHIVKEHRGSFAEEHHLAIQTMIALMDGFISHRGSGYPPMTKQQAREMATLMSEFRELSLAYGFEPMSLEKAKAVAERVKNAPKPTKN